MIDPAKYGVSFSLKQCRNFGLDPSDALAWLLAGGWRRFRLMSYWDEHEHQRGAYDFSTLDAQIELIARAGGSVTLCLGVKQPRWPEYHWPVWTQTVDATDRDAALLTYVGTVVTRYRGSSTVESWQLENEALLKGFGERIDIDRRRLRSEYKLVRKLDAARPILMSTSNGWGIPLRRPRPDVVGLSYYPVMYKDGAYHKTIQKPWLHRLRTHFVHVLLGKPVFIHELQCEPWGPTAIWKMDTAVQNESMSVEQIALNIAAAKRIGVYPIDLWGAEWWYWSHLQGNDGASRTVAESLMNDGADSQPTNT